MMSSLSFILVTGMPFTNFIQEQPVYHLVKWYDIPTIKTMKAVASEKRQKTVYD